MKLEWLEDMMALYSAKSLSAAAVKRNVSQPAFSRRIQALEDWLGVELIDRGSKPVLLTTAGRDQEAIIRSLVGRIYELRAASRMQAKGQKHLAIASQHSLSALPLLDLLDRHQGSLRNSTYHLSTGDRQDCIARMISGDADLLYCYEKPNVLHTVPPAIAQTIVAGYDRLTAVCTPQLQARLTKSGRRNPIIPTLAYPRESFFGDLLWSNVLIQMMDTNEMDIVCLSSFSYGLLDLALSGLGVAWLPERLVAGALADGRLMQFGPAGEPISLNVVIVTGRKRMEDLTFAIHELVAAGTLKK